jgi:RNA polymerase sigma-70 factor (ECF subfamily)
MRHHRRHPETELPEQVDDRSALSAPDPAAGVLSRDALDRAFVRLDPDQRIVIALRFYRDLQVDQIAARLGIPTGTVKSRLHKSLQRLRTELERQGWREEA